MSESVLAESLRSEPVRPELSESQTLESQMAQAEPAVSAGRPQAVQSKQAEAYRPQTGVTAESVSDTATEDIKAAGAAAKIPAETQHLQPPLFLLTLSHTLLYNNSGLSLLLCVHS